jgi:branched-chain amino acid transport system permease protein
VISLLASIIIDSIAYGMILFIISVGLSITLGLMRFVNLAHGVFAVAGGYAAVYIAGHFGLGYELSVLLSVLLVAATSLPLEAVFIRRLYKRSQLDQVLFTIGMVFVGIAGAGLMFGNALTPITLPSYLQGSIDIGFRVIPRQRLAALVVGLAVLALLHWLLTKTRFGIEVKATVDLPEASEALGIRTSRVYSLAFALGAGLAAVGGIVGAELLPIDPYYPLKYLVAFLAVVSVGGAASPFGLLAAALLLGFIETTAKYFASEYASMLFYITMLAVLTWRPEGLFGRREAK